MHVQLSMSHKNVSPYKDNWYCFSWNVPESFQWNRSMWCVPRRASLVPEMQTDLVQSRAVSWHPPVQRRGRVWSWSLHWGCSPGAGSYPAWLTALTSTLLCLFHSLYIYEAPKRQQTYKIKWSWTLQCWRNTQHKNIINLYGNCNETQILWILIIHIPIKI